MKETDDKIAVLGDSNYRFDIPKSMIISSRKKCNSRYRFSEMYKYQVDKTAPLSTGEPI
jgi:hypothetical protein